MYNLSPVFNTDSYKVSHWLQFPENMENAVYYVESRGGKFKATEVAGIAYLQKLLQLQITEQDVIFAKHFYKQHFGQDVFNYDGFMRIVKEKDGYLPITVRTIPEGTVVPVKTPLAVVYAEEGFGWLVGFLETMILRAIWYPTTVATISFEARKIIQKAMEETCDLTVEDGYNDVLLTRLHDFGARGVECSEASQIGGLAHLYNFKGSDNVEAILLSNCLFGTQMSGVSVPAREHSTTTCYLQEGEYDAFMNSVDNFGGGIFSVVVDSYSTDKAIEWLTTNQEFLEKLTNKGGTCVIRPDSGLPIDMVMMCIQRVAKNVGYTYNSKGYKVLDNRFRVLQGDGVNISEIQRIVDWMTHHHHYSMENLVFGMGGGMLQQLDRDTQKFAMKCCAMKVNGVWRDVFKAPETDPNKKSKAGILDVIINDDGLYETIRVKDINQWHPRSAMRQVYSNGKAYNQDNMAIIRNRVDKSLTGDL